jgi:hypothetical protein
VVATITNGNAQPVKVKMTSGVAGFTNSSVKTVTIAARTARRSSRTPS